MHPSRSAALQAVGSVLLLGATTTAVRAADTVADLVRGAKTEGELTLLAGGDSYGDQPGMRALNDAFNKRFGLSAHISLTPGPSMPAVASRIATEFKGNRPASTGVYLGPISTFVSLDRDGVLERVDWVKTFPWINRSMVIAPNGEGLLIRTDPDGIVYSPKVLAAEKAPKRYEDLVDPRLSGAWAGKLAVAPYPDWLCELTITWGVDRVREFAKKLMTLGGGSLRYGEVQALFDGQYALMANEGSALEIKWHWEEKGAPLNVVFGAQPSNCDYYQLGVPKNSATPNLAKLFVGFMSSQEAQAITDKYGAQSSHAVPGTRMYRFVRESRVAMQDPRKLYAFYSAPGTPALYDELGKIIRQ